MQIIVHPKVLPLANPFRIAHESRTEQPTLIVELVDATGRSGFGEAAMTRYYSLDSAECASALQNLAPALALRKSLSPAALHDFLDREAPTLHPFLRCALDVAAHDLEGKHQNKRIGELWDQPARRTPTCYTIGMGSIPEMVAKVKAFPWPLYKIKLGGDGDDLDIIRALRNVTDAPFYVDANTGWTAQQTIDYAPELQAMGVLLIEQPLLVADEAGQARVKAASPLPIIADESCQTEADVAKCAELFDGINIKIVKCGGLLPARRMIQMARERKLQVMAGCMTESSFGISAIAQLLPELDYADMDGAMLLAKDPGEGVTFDPRTGLAIYPDRPGTGARWRNE
ncbi:dipeptide epimerase [Lewinella sp. 4G2]|uniref:dipeptide epimerase n=1 Tax=Lewinella sp. 4G2 TaxID=1803372 RepID=UPI0007B48154|nr:dipeptide epimerase [Lewinella sp. 4G2]OAV43073.1 dipeptide epimerase [Lewinella sp. 4G2]